MMIICLSGTVAIPIDDSSRTYLISYCLFSKRNEDTCFNFMQGTFANVLRFYCVSFSVSMLCLFLTKSLP